MKKILFTGLLLSIALTISAQHQMQVWQDGVPTSFAVAEVDSITFCEKTPIVAGKIVGTMCCVDTINQCSIQGYFIITTTNDSILTFSNDVRIEKYYGIGGVYGVEYDIPFTFTFELLESSDNDYVHYEIPISNTMLPSMRYSIEDFRQAYVKRLNYDSIEYRPFIEDGKEWLVVAATNEVFWTKKYYIAEDTTVNNQLCKKLMYHFVDYVRDTTYTNLLYCIFEEDKKVYYYPSDITHLTQPILLYDFGAEIGDTISLGGQPNDNYAQISYEIVDTLTLENQGECFRGLQCIPSENEPDFIMDGDSIYSYLYYYESIGSIFDPFEKGLWNAEHMTGRISWLYECRVNNDVIYLDTRSGTMLSVENVSPSIPSAQKIIKDGQVLILRNGKTYTMQGQEVK